MAGLHPVVVVTGATGAIGSATAAVLVRRGARVLLLARPSDRLGATARRLGGEERRVSSIPVDLSSMSSVRSAAREIARSVEHVDALLNVAAVFSGEFRKTRDGFEVMLATNHLGPFLLTNLLRDSLAGRGRVITVTAPASTKVDFEHLIRKKYFRALDTFGATKAANLLFTFELARRAKRWEVRANACHPGLVRSDLMREAWAPIRVVRDWFRVRPLAPQRTSRTSLDRRRTRAPPAGCSKASSGSTRPARRWIGKRNLTCGSARPSWWSSRTRVSESCDSGVAKHPVLVLL